MLDEKSRNSAMRPMRPRTEGALGGITVTGDRAIAVYQEVVTVGMRPRLRSKKRRNLFCVPCGVSIALGPRPESGAFASEIYEMLRDIVSQDPSLVAAAYDHLVDPRAPTRRLAGSVADRTMDSPVLRAPALQEVS
jgi:hypothetical protein